MGADERIRYRGIPAVAIDLPESQLAALRASGLVTSVETDARLRTFDHEGGVADPELAASWGVAHIGAGAVHAHPNRGAGVTIAIIDTGIDYTHPELDAHYVGGYDFHNGDADPMDDNQHGTHVAGIEAAEANGGGVVGVAPEASLLAYKVLGADGSGDYSALIAALECARGIPPNGVPQSACPGADVVNMSLGGTEDSPALQAALQAAYDDGIVLVAAAGNTVTFWEQLFGCSVAYPGAYDSVVLTVSATDQNDALTSFSCKGPEVDVAAPGAAIQSTVPNGGYATFSGTSMATPHMAGLAALILASGNAAGPDAVEAQVCAAAAPGGVLAPTDPQYAHWYGCGVIDASAVDDGIEEPPVASVAQPSRATVGSLVSLDGSASVDPDGGTLSYAWTVLSAPLGSASTLNGAVDGAVANFVLDIAGGYTLELQVVDVGGLSDVATVVVGASTDGADRAWVEDALPAGATAFGTWSWVSANPAPASGAVAHQSLLQAGAHQHYFPGASATITPRVGDSLFASVYLDTSNPPSEIMLQWNDGTWEHRAFWGANLLAWGIDGTVARHDMGPLPPAGEWVRLEVPADVVGVEGAPLNGMAFAHLDGRATWDLAGLRGEGAVLSGLAVSPGSAHVGLGGTQQFAATGVDQFGDPMPVAPAWTVDGGGAIDPATGLFSAALAPGGPFTVRATQDGFVAAASVTVSEDSVWFDDALAAGATAYGAWSWIGADPAPYSGAFAHDAPPVADSVQHYFAGASETLSAGFGDTLFAYVYLDAADPPSEVMLQWNDGTWEHRAYWGANLIPWGVDGTDGRRYVGPLPAAGQWARLEVPAAVVGLEGRTLSGMAFVAHDGGATWDLAGAHREAPVLTSIAVTPASAIVALAGTQQFTALGLDQFGNSLPVSPVWSVDGGGSIDAASGLFSAAAAEGSFTVTATDGAIAGHATVNVSADRVWIEDATPAGATLVGAWDWIDASPSPYSGSLAHRSAVAVGARQHYFYDAAETLTAGANDMLFAYVYLDPANPPRELMLQWNNGSWEHRAYWGENLLPWGADGTAARRYMGALPPAGAWTRIEVPASLVGVAGTTISGMAYSLYDGTATWDRAGARTETPVLSSIEVTPAAATVEPGASQQFTATGRDQFGGALPVAPAWSVDGDGSIDAAGLYAARSTPGVFTITASEGSLTGSTVVTVAPRVDVVWFDDGLPAGATSYGTWDWVDAAPTPYSGLLAHRSTIAAGAHQHYFEGASATLDVAVGETLFAWVYLDPANMPGEIMLQWNDGIWDHRAYWGGNLIPWGVDGTNSRRYMGPLPTAGQWVRLEVPAAMVGLEGRALRGMAFTLYDGGATWDLAGKR